MPFAGYKNFDTCVAANSGKRNPQAYCATIMRAVEGKDKTLEINGNMRAYGDTTKMPDGFHIRINPKKGDVVNTIIHEALHAQDWKAPEKKVIRDSHKIEGRMTLPQMAQLLLDTHAKAQAQPKRRQITYTTASKVTRRVIK